jgi:hypothetical protein
MKWVIEALSPEGKQENEMDAALVNAVVKAQDVGLHTTDMSISPIVRMLYTNGMRSGTCQGRALDPPPCKAQSASADSSLSLASSLHGNSIRSNR